jgi:hypothetical protein
MSYLANMWSIYDQCNPVFEVKMQTSASKGSYEVELTDLCASSYDQRRLDATGSGSGSGSGTGSGTNSKCVAVGMYVMTSSCAASDPSHGTGISSGTGSGTGTGSGSENTHRVQIFDGFVQGTNGYLVLNVDKPSNQDPYQYNYGYPSKSTRSLLRSGVN